MNSLDKMPALELEAGDGIAISSVKESPVLKKNVYYYLDKVSGRNIFKMGAEEKTEEIVEVEELVEKPDQKIALKSALSEKMANLKLVGISWSSSPDAIIENISIQQSVCMIIGKLI